MSANKNWTKLTWEEIESDDNQQYWRAKVPGGWLVRAAETATESGAMTFVPAPE